MSDLPKKIIFSAIKLKGGELNETSAEEFRSYNTIAGDELVQMKEITNLSKVNIFVGANNSGKSRFLRELSKIKFYLAHVKDRDEPDMDTFKLFEDHDLEGNYSVETQQHLNGFVGRNIIVSREEQKYRELLGGHNRNYSDLFQRTYIPINRGFIRFDLAADAVEHRQEGSHFFIGKSYPDFKLLYLEKDLFQTRTERLYGLQKGITSYRIATGYDFYNEVKQMLLGDTGQRKIVSNFQQFLSKYFYENKEVLLIPNENSRVLFIKIGDDEKEVYRLGDGVQNVVHILFEVFKRKNCLFFIEEPELMMHPGMQRKLMEIILSNDIEELKDANQQFFLTTHSNHLLDLTLEYQNISVYKFSSLDNNQKKVEQVSFGDSSLLQELGVQNSSVMLANKTIWVEGISDRNYIRKFLELYIEKHHPQKSKSLIEDIDYVVAEYQGSNIEHWLFKDSNEQDPINIDRFCSESLFIADTDGTNKAEKHTNRKALLGEDRYLTTSGREIENMLSIKSIVDGINGFSRSSGLELSPEMINKYKDRDVYTNTNYSERFIGTFIDSELKPSGNTFAEKIGTGSTIKSTKKNNFSFYATRDMKYEDLTTEAITFTEFIYKFIIK